MTAFDDVLLHDEAESLPFSDESETHLDTSAAVNMKLTLKD
jgi:hypothetical protein